MNVVVRATPTASLEALAVDAARVDVTSFVPMGRLDPLSTGHRATPGSRPGEAGAVGEDDGLDAVTEVELGEDVPDVGLDGGLGQRE